MTTYDPTDEECTDLDDRDVRALTECMTVLDDAGQARHAPGLYQVTTESGSQYLVDVRHESCDCPDATHRDVRCKHIRRAEFATARRPVPQWVDTDAVDPQLGTHVGGPVATDGGQSDADDASDDDCEECAALPDGWTCADCYVIDGVEMEGPA